jgi:hypothetical protein
VTDLLSIVLGSSRSFESTGRHSHRCRYYECTSVVFSSSRRSTSKTKSSMLRHISTTRAGLLAWKLQLPPSVRRSISTQSDTTTVTTHCRCGRTRQRLSLFSTNSSSNENESNKYSGMEDSLSSSLEPSPVLTAAWPLLQERFESLKNADGVFPLLNQAQEERFENMAAKSHTDAHEKKKETSDDNTGKGTSTIHKEYDKPGGTTTTTTTTTTHREDRPKREAAVLMILCSVNGQPGVLYTKRANHMFLHAGEISFPGGHFHRRTRVSWIRRFEKPTKNCCSHCRHWNINNINIISCRHPCYSHLT